MEKAETKNEIKKIGSYEVEKRIIKGNDVWVPKHLDNSKSLAICGTAPSLKAAPFDNPNFEIWACSPALPSPDLKRADLSFEMHPKRYYGMPNVTDRLINFQKPVYMQDFIDIVPNSIPYPREAIKAEFELGCMNGVLYATNTISWMILLAIYLGYEDLNLFGVHMAHQSEYGYQQPSCSWALGIAQGRGCSIWLPKESTLLHARYEYGYDEPTKLMDTIEQRVQELTMGAKQLHGQIEDIAVKKAKTEGALLEAQHWYRHVAGQE